MPSTELWNFWVRSDFHAISVELSSTGRLVASEDSVNESLKTLQAIRPHL